jgi:hypothetical protein
MASQAGIQFGRDGYPLQTQFGLGDQGQCFSSRPATSHAEIISRHQPEESCTMNIWATLILWENADAAVDRIVKETDHDSSQWLVEEQT